MTPPMDKMASAKVKRREKYFMKIVTLIKNGQSYAFIENMDGLPTRLICHEKSNLERHFSTKHNAFANKYPAGDARKRAITEL